MAKFATTLSVAGLLAAAFTPTLAQDTARPAVSGYARPVAYPNANAAAVADHFNKARKLAGDDLFVFFDTLCVQDQLYRERTNGAQYLGVIPSQKVFDNLYYVGQMSVSAWAITTPAGIILIDTLNNTDEARDIIVAGLKEQGLDPKDIKYIIITHSHGDHYAGAQYLKDTYGAKLIASQADWDVMAKGAPAGRRNMFDPPPRKGADDIVAGDGQVISLGGTDVHLGLTPAHTPGTLSLWFKTTDHGKPHTVGMYGGIGMPRTDDLKQLQLKSMAHWMEMSKAAGVDAQIGNHPLHFNGPTRLEELRYLPPNGKNPFVIGSAAYQRFMGMMSECVKMSLARDGVAAD
jgi:metallo-beta-lactamase class B